MATAARGGTNPPWHSREQVSPVRKHGGEDPPDRRGVFHLRHKRVVCVVDIDSARSPVREERSS